MAVPKKKTSPSKRNMRRAHHALKTVNYVETQETGELTIQHQMSTDGFYKGKRVFATAEEVEAAETA